MPEIARSSGSKRQQNETSATAKREHVSFDGRRYPLVKEVTGTWRMRSRAKTHSIDEGLGTTDLPEAKRVAKRILEERAAKKKPRGSETVKDATDLYKGMPKRVNQVSAEANVGRLEKMIKYTWDKETSEVKLADIGPKLWRAYANKRHKAIGLDGLDLSTRRPENAAINSAIRQACSPFIPALRPVYAEHKMIVPDDATVIQWLPEIKAPPPTADVKNLDAGIEELATVAPEMYFCLGAARWAGLRRSEIKALRREWLVVKKGKVFIQLHDRPEEGYLTKTGAIYSALVINPTFAEALLAIPDGMLIVNPSTTDRDGWFEREPQNWLRPYTGKAKKPLHRLRGLYADDVKRITEDAILASAAGTKEASRNLGHTTTATTEKSYLSHEDRQTHT